MEILVVIDKAGKNKMYIYDVSFFVTLLFYSKLHRKHITSNFVYLLKSLSLFCSVIREEKESGVDLITLLTSWDWRRRTQHKEILSSKYTWKQPRPIYKKALCGYIVRWKGKRAFLGIETFSSVSLCLELMFEHT